MTALFFPRTCTTTSPTQNPRRHWKWLGRLRGGPRPRDVVPIYCSHIGGIEASLSHLFEVSIRPPVSKWPIFTTPWLSTLDESPWLVHNLRCCSGKRQRAHPRGCLPPPLPPAVSPPAYLFAKSLRAPTRCSHAPCGGAWARNTFASLGSALSCVTKTPFGFLQLYWPPHAAPHQLHCFSSCFVDTHQMQSSIPRHARQCDPSLPLD